MRSELRSIATGLALALALVAAPAAADPPLDAVLDDLFVGDLVNTMARGEIQTSVLHEYESDGGYTNELVFNGQYGVTDDFQLSVDVPYRWIRTSDESSQGIGSIDIEGLYSVYRDADAQREITSRLAIGLPAVDKSRADGREYSYEPALIGYQGFENGFVNAELGLDIEDPTGAGEPTTANGFVGLAVAWAWKTVVATLETEVTFGNAQTEVILAPGLTYTRPLGEGRFEAGVGVPVGLTGPSPDIGGVFRMSYRFGGGATPASTTRRQPRPRLTLGARR